MNYSKIMVTNTVATTLPNLPPPSSQLDSAGPHAYKSCPVVNRKWSTSDLPPSSSQVDSPDHHVNKSSPAGSAKWSTSDLPPSSSQVDSPGPHAYKSSPVVNRKWSPSDLPPSSSQVDSPDQRKITKGGRFARACPLAGRQVSVCSVVTGTKKSVFCKLSLKYATTCRNAIVSTAHVS